MRDVQACAAEYLAHGWKLCRIHPGSKSPLNGGWNDPGKDIRNVEAFTPGHGIGLLHAYSGTCAIDIDAYDVARKFLEARAVALDALLFADDAVRINSGRSNSAKLLYALPEPRVSVNCAPFAATNAKGKPIMKMGLNLRCAAVGGASVQDCLPPTMHPTVGKPYAWEFGICGDWRSLPPLPAELEALWDELSIPVSQSQPTVAVPVGAAPDELARWLKSIDPGCSRAEWVKVGMKIHAEYQGSMAGFALWQDWSSKSAKWDDEARLNMLPYWHGFKLEGRPLATLEYDLRMLPAEPEDFKTVSAETVSEDTTALAEFASPDGTDLIGDLGPAAQIVTENAFEREVRTVLQDWVVLQTGGAKSYYVRPGHPVKEIAKAAGLAGVEIGQEQLRNIFGPYLPPTLIGQRVVPTDPVDVMRRAKWRKTVHRMAFRPGGELNYTSDDGHVYLNAYKPIDVKPVKPTPSQIAPLEWLLARVLDNKDEPTGGTFATWLVRLYAFVLQNPGIKVKWAPLLYSEVQGTGKTTLMQTLPALLFGPQYVKSMVHSILRERFAGAKFDSTWWVCISEMHADTGKVDAKGIANKLKPWITDDTIPIEKKGVDSFEIANYLQLTASSNHADALFIEEGSSDRRWLIGEMYGRQLTTQEMANLNPLFGADFVRHPLAQSWLHWYFKHNVDVRGFNPSEAPPETKAKQRVREESRSVWEDLVFDALETRKAPFDKDVLMPKSLTEELLCGRNVTLAQARRLLVKAGAQQMKRTDEYRTIFSVRNHDLWREAKPREIKDHLLHGTRPFKIVDADKDLI